MKLQILKAAELVLKESKYISDQLENIIEDPDPLIVIEKQKSAFSKQHHIEFERNEI